MQVLPKMKLNTRKILVHHYFITQWFILFQDSNVYCMSTHKAVAVGAHFQIHEELVVIHIAPITFAVPNAVMSARTALELE